jgi:hypothetical protein
MFFAVAMVAVCQVTHAQLAPSIAYMFPSGGQAGSTVDVTLGGYDWTPDVEPFARDARIRLEITGKPGPVIVPEPPYWFGKKARRSPFLLPRETPAKLSLPSDLEPGIYRWQVASANGVSKSGKFVVSSGREVVEIRDRREPQQLESLPVTVSGQILKIQEVDRYRFKSPISGLITLTSVATAIDSPLSAAVEVRDESGRMVADGADTAGRDLSVTFAAESGHEYVVSVYDIDFRGNRAFVYRLTIETALPVVTTVPAAIKRGATQDVRFVGMGVATGSAKLESVTRKVTASAAGSVQAGEFAASNGQTVSFRLPITDLAETIESSQPGATLAIPAAVTGVLSDRSEIDSFQLTGTKGDMWSIVLQAVAIGSPLDVSLVIINSDGKELKRIDDVPGTTDVRLNYTVPVDGTYELQVSDTSGSSGALDAIYRLAVRDAQPGFTLTVPEFATAPVGGVARPAIKAVRTGGFTGPIEIHIDGIPPGVTVPEIIIPEKKNDWRLHFSVASSAGTVAQLISVSGRAEIDGELFEYRSQTTLFAITMKPPFTIDAEGKNDVTKWPRGTTFPGPVLITRDESFNGEIVLEMSSRQGRHRQGIRGPELTVPPGVNRILYPVFLPEWLETTRTSRMVVNGVTKIKDPKGRERYLSSRLVTRIGFLPTGALLKVSTPLQELEVSSGQAFDFPVEVSRARELEGPVKLELILDDELQGRLTAEPVTIDNDAATEVALRIEPAEGVVLPSEVELMVRATGTRHGHPVVSETRLLVVFERAVQVGAK